MRSAVPLGASFLKRWWISVISTSYSSPSARAMVGSSLKASVTATDMFGASRIGARRASAAISSRCAAVNPVVPITARAPAARHQPQVLEAGLRDRELDEHTIGG